MALRPSGGPSRRGVGKQKGGGAGPGRAGGIGWVGGEVNLEKTQETLREHEGQAVPVVLAGAAATAPWRIPRRIPVGLSAMRRFSCMDFGQVEQGWCLFGKYPILLV